MIVYFPVFVFIVGLLMYYIAKTPETKEVGHIFIFCGCLAFLLRGSEPLVKLLQ